MNRTHAQQEGQPLPFSHEDTLPLQLHASVQAARACRPALTRISGTPLGQSFTIPSGRKAGLILGRGASAGLLIEDDTVSREHARLHVEADGSVHLTDLRSANGVMVNGVLIETAVLREGDKIQVGRKNIFRFSLNDRLDENYAQHLFDRSIRDPLTGMLNRRYLTECLERDLDLGLRHGLPMSLVLLDIDYFKKVNDNFGHMGGDEALCAVASLLNGMQRSESVFVRHGGEEFAAFLRGVDAAGAEIFAERMRHVVERECFKIGRGSIRLTLSAGVAVTTTDGVHTPAELIAQADRYLYLSKRLGRNRVSSARTNKL